MTARPAPGPAKPAKSSRFSVHVEDERTGESPPIDASPDFRSQFLRTEVPLPEEAIVPASMCEKHPLGGRHPDENGVPRSFGAKHMAREGAMALAAELEADQVRLVHLSHRYPVEEAFDPELGVDEEQFDRYPCRGGPGCLVGGELLEFAGRRTGLARVYSATVSIGGVPMPHSVGNATPDFL